MNKYMKNTNAIARAIMEDTASTRKQNDILMSLLLEQRQENRKMYSYIEAQIPDINKFFLQKMTRPLIVSLMSQMECFH